MLKAASPPSLVTTHRRGRWLLPMVVAALAVAALLVSVLIGVDLQMSGWWIKSGWRHVSVQVKPPYAFEFWPNDHYQREHGAYRGWVEYRRWAFRGNHVRFDVEYTWPVPDPDRPRQ